jgi:kanosamine 6-kinase
VSGYLGIDIGGTKVALRAERDGHCPRTGSHSWRAGVGGPDDLTALGGWVRLFAAELTAPDGRDEPAGPFAAVGVAVPATVDAAGLVTAWPSRPGWIGLDLGSALRSLFPGAAVGWADDGGLGALAEAAGSGCEDLLYLGVGTGVGGGLALGGVPHPRPGRPACEIGHVIVRREGPRCPCGRTGCLQATASGAAVLSRAGQLRHAPVTFEELAAGMTDGLPWATTPVTEACEALAIAVVSVTELLHPALVLIGGGFATCLPGFTATVDKMVRALARPGFPVPPVRAAADGLSSLRGAVQLARSLGGPAAVSSPSTPVPRPGRAPGEPIGRRVPPRR